MESVVPKLELHQNVFESYQTSKDDHPDSPEAKIEEPPAATSYETDGEEDAESANMLTKSEHNPSLKFILCEVKQFNICMAKIVSLIPKLEPAETEEAKQEAEEL